MRDVSLKNCRIPVYSFNSILVPKELRVIVFSITQLILRCGVLSLTIQARVASSCLRSSYYDAPMPDSGLLEDQCCWFTLCVHSNWGYLQVYVEMDVEAKGQC